MTVGELISELSARPELDCYIDGKHETLDRIAVNGYLEGGRVFLTPKDNSIDKVSDLLDALSKCDKDAPVFLFDEFWDAPEEFKISVVKFDCFDCGCFMPGCSCGERRGDPKPEYSFEAVIFKPAP